jgi:hypothetical protein
MELHTLRVTGKARLRATEHVERHSLYGLWHKGADTTRDCEHQQHVKRSPQRSVCNYSFSSALAINNLGGASIHKTEHLAVCEAPLVCCIGISSDAIAYAAVAALQLQSSAEGGPWGGRYPPVYKCDESI